MMLFPTRSEQFANIHSVPTAQQSSEWLSVILLLKGMDVLGAPQGVGNCVPLTDLLLQSSLVRGGWGGCHPSGAGT